MIDSIQCPRHAISLGVAVILTMAASVAAATADDRQPRVFPLAAAPYGNTYGEWTARWWQWLLAIPADKNPNLDTTGQHCAEGQAGPVWFLAGSFGGSFTRSCTVPAGKALLLPVQNTIFGAGVFDCTPTVPDALCDLNAIRQSAAANQDDPQRLEAKVDAFRVENLRNFRVQSPAILLTYPDDNVVAFLFGAAVPGGAYTPNVSDGYWLFLPPLSKGQHTIRTRAVAANGFSVAMTFHLTIGK
jgi:hypothetical protein